MKIKAFENINHVNGVYQQKSLDKEGEFYLHYTDTGKDFSIKYSKGISLQQAQAMLKVLDIELIEEKEINTFKEFDKFLFEADLTYRGREYKDVFYDDEAEYNKSIYEIEEEHCVKLNILK